MIQDSLAVVAESVQMTTTQWLMLLSGGVLLVVLLVLWDRKKTGKSLATVIRTWPHTDTLLMSGVLLSAWTVVFYEGCLVAFKVTSFEPFKDSMEPVFTFLNWMVLTGAGASIGRRMTTKPEVIETQVRNNIDPATGELRVPGSSP